MSINFKFLIKIIYKNVNLILNKTLKNVILILYRFNFE